MANVFILRSYSAPDEDVKTIYANSVLEEGDALGLGALSTARGTRGAYLGAAPAAGDTVVMVYNADIPTLSDGNGNVIKGILSDPRGISYPENTVVNAFIPHKGIEIGMTKVKGINDIGAWTKGDSDEFIVINAGDTKPTYAASKEDALVAFKITRKGFVTIGSERVPTIEAICE